MRKDDNAAGIHDLIAKVFSKREEENSSLQIVQHNCESVFPL